jgi:hypothetical protein
MIERGLLPAFSIPAQAEVAAGSIAMVLDGNSAAKSDVDRRVRSSSGESSGENNYVTSRISYLGKFNRK